VLYLTKKKRPIKL